MAFSGDHPVVENILFDVSGSALALVHSSSIGPDLLSQPGVMMAGFHSSSGGGYQAALLQLDDEGRLLVNAEIAVTGGTQSVTGSVAITNVVTVTGNVGITGPVTVTGAVTVTGTVTADVTGTINLDRGNDSVNPLFITGSVGITNPIVIGSGHVSASLDRGDSFANPLFTTGSVGINGIVSTREVISTVSSGTYVLASTSPVTLQAANPNRHGLVIYNLSNKAMYVKFGTGAGPLDFTFKIFSDDVYNVPVLYTGIITAAWVTGASLGAMVTEITP